jgi:hypothetical protein
MTFSRNRAGLSATQLSALVKLRLGALPWINRAFGRKRASPSTWISYITASALVREGLATISVSGCGSWLRLTASGRLHAQALAEPAEAERQPSPGPGDRGRRFGRNRLTQIARPEC